MCFVVHQSGDAQFGQFTSVKPTFDEAFDAAVSRIRKPEYREKLQKLRLPLMEGQIVEVDDDHWHITEDPRIPACQYVDGTIMYLAVHHREIPDYDFPQFFGVSDRGLEHFITTQIEQARNLIACSNVLLPTAESYVLHMFRVLRGVIN